MGGENERAKMERDTDKEQREGEGVKEGQTKMDRWWWVMEEGHWGHVAGKAGNGGKEAKHLQCLRLKKK